MSEPIKLEQPDRLIKIRAQLAAKAIGAIAQLISELNDRTSENHTARIKELEGLWDSLSEAIEDPENEVR
jgi:hypothetical protein